MPDEPLDPDVPLVPDDPKELELATQDIVYSFSSVSKPSATIVVSVYLALDGVLKSDNM
jgi:hypothetical protein